ncbi:hypothetical protein [Stygiolobus caldivivus]|uniref:Uncharacterized protein n=1 Tax=Stygiolobus caldivivus TaxID=2824673 RepID=A0A8D5U5D6_9CREN|nr:hypothetical protein [Stygiolobus caldivivus]BCU69201.1 hypothetical protein KN1_04980 [Stygiolobus caldivivus]
MPPSHLTIIDKVELCTTSSCIEKVVDEYLTLLIRKIKESEKTSDNFKLFDGEEDSLNEREFFNYYKFTETLIEKVIENDIDLEFIINDLVERLGKTHPVVLFLKQLAEE